MGDISGAYKEVKLDNHYEGTTRLYDFSVLPGVRLYSAGCGELCFKDPI